MVLNVLSNERIKNILPFPLKTSHEKKVKSSILNVHCHWLDTSIYTFYTLVWYSHMVTTLINRQHGDTQYFPWGSVDCSGRLPDVIQNNAYYSYYLFYRRCLKWCSAGQCFLIFIFGVFRILVGEKYISGLALSPLKSIHCILLCYLLKNMSDWCYLWILVRWLLINFPWTHTKR
jgi:hypothetical protein